MGDIDGATICGDCGNRYDRHYFEGDYIYCNADTNGDTFRAKDIEEFVCDDIKARQQVGLVKYGVTLAENPLSLLEWLRHAYHECLDQALYLKRAMAELERRCGDE